MVPPLYFKYKRCFIVCLSTNTTWSCLILNLLVTCVLFNVYVGEAELQRVPGSFDSVQEYVNVFEPLLFEECRAQLHSTWEELCEGVTKDPHVQVSVKAVEKRDRGTVFDSITAGY